MITLDVLYLTNQLPWPPVSGGQVREWELLRRLRGRCGIHFISVGESLDRDTAAARQMPLRLSSLTLAASTPDEAPPGSSYRVRVHYRRGYHHEVGRMIEVRRPDVIHVEGYFLMQHVPTTDVPVFVLAENVEHTIEARLGDMPDRLIAAERAALSRATAIGAVSEPDAVRLRQLVPGHGVAVVPNGVDGLSARRPRDSATPRLPPVAVYVANYTWPPSADGARNLLTNLWPGIHERVPSARLLLVGPGMDDGLRRLVTETDGAAETGYVEDLEGLYADADLVLCPLRFGGGSKLKMLEALRRGLPIVAFPPCVDGIPLDNPGAVRVCGTDEAFVEAAAALLTDPALRAELARRAETAASSLPSWAQAAELLLGCWAGLTDRRAEHSRPPC